MEKLIVFDLDGTLVDSIEGIAVSMNRVLSHNGFDTYSIEKYKDFVGNGIKRLVYRALPENSRDDSLVEKHYRQMCENYRKYYSSGLRLYPGIAELLNSLSELNVKMAINTNKNQDITDLIVKEFLCDWNFVKVIGANSGYEKKPNPEGVLDIMKTAGVGVDDTFYVGDSEVDIMTAKKAGVNSIAVSWGFRSYDDLVKFTPRQIVNKPEEILWEIGNEIGHAEFQ